MAISRYVSTARVAEALGVSVTTVKRWVDGNVLPAHRTAGGHRKILLGDVLRLVHENKLPHVDLRLLHGDERDSNGADPEDRSRQLYEALERGDAEGVGSKVVGAYESGLSMVCLGDQVIAPAMHRLGHDWEAGRIGVHHEHHASRLCLEALLEVKQRLERDGEKTRPLAIGGAPEHDHSLLPSLLIEMVLLEGGWRVINYGAHTPLRSLRRALEEERPELLWLSVTHLGNAEAFLEEYHSLYEAARERDVKVAVGGQGLIEPVRARMTYTMFGDGLIQLSEFARSLNPHPRLPQRGRPPRRKG